MLGIKLLFILTSMSWGWSEHHLITQSSLCAFKEQTGKKVVVTSFEKLIGDLGFKSAEDFNRSLQIHTKYKFAYQAGEKPNQAIAIYKVLGTYSDEPDWGMDQDIFDADQFPTLWKDEYVFMGGRHGFSSQASRHMYFPEWSLANAVAGVKLPVTKIFSPMGNAPQRAQVFYELAMRAKQAGHYYWSFRFLANALHYVEDVTQPFHAVQTPSKKYIVMPFFSEQGRGFKNYVIQVQNIVAYYHFAFEDTIGRLMVKGFKPFYEALQFQGQEVATRPIDQQVIANAKFSMSRAAQAAALSFENFPPIQEPFDIFDAKKFMNEQWWDRVLKNLNTQPMENYFGLVRELFANLGATLRSVVVQADLLNISEFVQQKDVEISPVCSRQ